MTELQAQKLFDKLLEDAEKKGKEKQQYIDHCFDMLMHQYVLWFGKKESEEEE